jgi:hypothetical protein
LAASITAIAQLALVTASSGFAWAEPADSQPVSPISLGMRPGVAPGTEAGAPDKRAADSIEWNARAGFTTDYIYRGVTLSDHKPDRDRRNTLQQQLVEYKLIIEDSLVG